MLLNPWRRIKVLQQELDRDTLYISQLRNRIQADVTAYLVIQREVILASAALRRKNRQLKHLKASVELHKEYIKLHTPQSTR